MKKMQHSLRPLAQASVVLKFQNLKVLEAMISGSVLKDNKKSIDAKHQRRKATPKI
jgi:hypothetical protein